MMNKASRNVVAVLLLVGLGVGLLACTAGSDTGSFDTGSAPTSIGRPSSGLTLCQDWRTRADGKVWCGNEVALSGDLKDLLDLKGKVDAANEVVDFIDDSRVRQAIAGLKEIDAAGLSRSEIASLRELSTFRRHPSVSTALFEDLMVALQKVLSHF